MSNRGLPIPALVLVVLVLAALAAFTFLGDTPTTVPPTPDSPDGGPPEPAVPGVLEDPSEEPPEPPPGEPVPAADTLLIGTVSGPEGKPVAGALIRVLAREEVRTGSMWSGPSESQVRMGVELLDEGGGAPGTRLETDEDGEFRVAGLRPGRYFVAARARGLAAGEVEEVEVTEGREARVELILAEGVAIRGRVLDTRKEGVATARIVTLPFDRATDTPYVPVLETASGPDGAFVVEGCAPGESYLLLARAPDGRLGFGIRIPAPSEDVEISVGPRLTLVGTVRDQATGEPLEGASLVTLLGVARSDQNGAYRLEGFVKSPFFRYVWATAEGYERTAAEIDLGRALFAGREIEQDFALEPIRPGRLRITARDFSGTPLRGAALILRREYRGPVVARAITGPDGEGLFSEMPAGNYLLTALKPGHVMVVTWDVEDGDEMAGMLPYVSVTVPADEEGEEEVRLAPVAALEGVVLSEDGTPLPGVDIRQQEEERLGITDEDGRFELRGLPGGVLTWLRFSKPGYTAEFLDAKAGEGVPVEVVLRQAGGIAGVLVDPDGKKVPGQRVYAVHPGEQNYRLSAQTTADGRFLIENVPPGSWHLLVQSTGYVRATVGPVDIVAGETADGGTIRLSHGIEVTFQVRGQDGEAAGAYVLLWGPLDAPEGARQVHSPEEDDPNPPAKIRLQPGRYTVVLLPAEGVPGGASELDMEFDRDQEMVATLPAEAKTIRVRVVRAETDVLQGMYAVRREPESPPVATWIQAGEGDLLTTGGLPPGLYGIYVMCERGGSWERREFTGVSPGGEVREVDFTK